MPPLTHQHMQDRIRRVMQARLGYDQLRPGQEAAIQSLLQGRDTLAIMPTGAGKSAIYQVVGLQLSGPVAVISPLIALQRDQLEAIEEHNLGAAASINSHETAGQREEALDDAQQQSVKFLFLAPEQFANDDVLESLRAARPALFVVDEAHCISEWGHDFRPAYLRLGSVIEALGRPLTLALTATAAPPVREEIIERLGMREPRVIVRGFDRPNIWLGVERFRDDHAKLSALTQRASDAEKPGIVYVATRRHAEQVAQGLRDAGMRAAHYHAGMKAAERAETQQRFMDGQNSPDSPDDRESPDGTERQAGEPAGLDIIVATTAFGMGIDKPNVRFVYHYDISDSLDAYYQEIGRAGRDGEPAEAILFYRSADVGLRKFFAGGGQVDLDEIEVVAEAVRAHHEPTNPRELQEETGLSHTKLAAAVGRLEEVGAVTVLANGDVEPTERISRRRELLRAVREAVGQQEDFQQFQRSRIAMMQGYAETLACRRSYLLNYFGEEFSGPCEACDNDLDDSEDGAEASGEISAGACAHTDEHASGPFPLSSRVAHARWGAGSVMRYEDDTIYVLFDSVGYKTLALELVTEQGLLRPISENEDA